jgi:hypothetical protein
MHLGSLAGGCVDWRGELVYRINIVCESGALDSPLTDRYIHRHSTGRQDAFQNFLVSGSAESGIFIPKSRPAREWNVAL